VQVLVIMALVVAVPSGGGAQVGDSASPPSGSPGTVVTVTTDGCSPPATIAFWSPTGQLIDPQPFVPPVGQVTVPALSPGVYLLEIRCSNITIEMGFEVPGAPGEPVPNYAPCAGCGVPRGLLPPETAPAPVASSPSFTG
jgi:hypothetical protein